MTSKGRDSVTAAVQSCYSTWGDTYYEQFYGPDAPYPPVHRDLVIELLRDAKATNVLDAGCGPASMLRDLPAEIEPYGFDLTPEMVAEAGRVLGERGGPATRIWQGSATDRSAYRLPDAGEGYDAAICIGVFPHISEPDDPTVIHNLVGSVRPGGLVVIEARNAFFALYTLNRHTRDFFFERLLPLTDLRARAGAESGALDEALAELEEMFRTDLPPVRQGKHGEPGYDEIISRTHDPLRLKELAERAGLDDVRLLYYHFHSLPPLVGARVPKLERAVSLEMENADDPRGLFMASAFLIAGTKRDP